jgi:hypothetical protein
LIDDKLNDRINRFFKKREMCVSPCVAGTEKKMSFFNDNFVDSSKVYCYNCLIDSKEKNKAYAPDYGGTYIYWPDLADPVNGPPYV